VRSIRRDDRVICASRSTADDVCSVLALDPAHVVIARPGAEPSLFHPITERAELERVRCKYGIPADISYVLSVNTREPRKNIAGALRAFEAAVADHRLSDLAFVLVGGAGWQHEEIDHLLAARGRAQGRVYVTGYVPDCDLAALYSGAMFFVYPSFCEGFGLPPLEAMQCGTAVITSNTSSLPEVVGRAALMVDPLDSDALAQAMLGLYRDGAKREALACAGRQQAGTFSWQRCAEDTVRAYRNALAQP
jgi:glycosyltransferase involved in cell wall biosynthesis